jgi:cellulose synthase/poly-beta-1,6-N-acetylglucosamine synthase-like glycosyltransferase
MKKSYNKYVEDYMKKRVKQSKIISNRDTSIITCTNLPYSLNNIIENFIRQDYEKKELIIIINNNKIDEKEWKEKASKYENMRVFKLDENISLGKCLNFGVNKAKYGIIAKFDDDDYYGPKYLSDSIKYFNNIGAKVVGKGTTLVYLVENKILTIRNPGQENKYTKFVNGSTLVFKKEIFNKVRFRDLNVTEDVYFCSDCLKVGIKIYSSNKYHHIYFRHPFKENHTWKIKDKEFLNSYCNTHVLKKHLNSIDDVRQFADI